MPPNKLYKTCSLCRRRKTKCEPVPPQDIPSRYPGDPSTGPCRSCVDLEVKCEYGHVYKKAGRPNTYANPNRSRILGKWADDGTWIDAKELDDNPDVSQNERLPAKRPKHEVDDVPFSARWSPAQHHANFRFSPRMLQAQPMNGAIGNGVDLPSSSMPTRPIPHRSESMASGSASTSTAPGTLSFDQARDASSRTSWYGPSQPPKAMPTSGPNAPRRESYAVGGLGGGLISTAFPSPEEPLNPPSASDGGSKEPASTMDGWVRSLRPPDLQIEDVAPWSTISHFVSLYLRYLHSLSPLVHKPSYSQALMMRRDKTDRAFRAFVLGQVAFAIGQSPTTRLLDFATAPELERLQRNCHLASMMLLDRSYRTPGVSEVCALIYGYFYKQSIGRDIEAAVLLAGACQLAISINLHEDLKEGNLIEIQQRRRIYWHLYAVDSTEASAGLPIHLDQHALGMPPLPDLIDDEYTTARGAFPQPDDTVSYMHGFCRCVSFFPILSDAVEKLRRLRRRTTPPSMQERRDILDWMNQAETRMANVMKDLPPPLTRPMDKDTDPDGVFGMQRANLLATEASVKFAILDLRAAIDPDASGVREAREAIAKEVHQSMSSIPLDHLAANGESMRGKVFRICLSLLATTDSDEISQSLHEWFSIFSLIQFVQMVPSSLNDANASRPASPRPQMPGSANSF